MPNKHLSANLVCLWNGFVKNCPATHGECEQTNRHSHWRQTNILRHSFNLRTSEGMRTKAFTITRSLLLYHPHIPILDKRMRSLAVCSAFVWYLYTWLKKYIREMSNRGHTFHILPRNLSTWLFSPVMDVFPSMYFCPLMIVLSHLLCSALRFD